MSFIYYLNIASEIKMNGDLVILLSEEECLRKTGSANNIPRIKISVLVGIDLDSRIGVDLITLATYTGYEQHPHLDIFQFFLGL